MIDDTIRQAFNVTLGEGNSTYDTKSLNSVLPIIDSETGLPKTPPNEQDQEQGPNMSVGVVPCAVCASVCVSMCLFVSVCGCLCVCVLYVFTGVCVSQHVSVCV